MGGKLFNRIRSCLRSQCRVKSCDINSFITNVKAVFLGIKPSYLLDQFSCTPEKFSELVTMILNDVDLYHFTLFRIVSFKNGDLFLVDIKQCMDVIKPVIEKLEHELLDLSVIDQLSSIVVNVTATLAEPKLYVASSKTIQMKIKNIYETIFNMLMQLYDSRSTSRLQTTDCIAIHSCCMPESINLCTVYGILLNYPFVYWFDEESSQDTCINMTELFVTKACIPISQCLDKSSSPTLYEIYSFSLPKSLLSNLSVAILKNWKSKIIPKVEMNFNVNYAMKEFYISAPCLSC